MIAALSSGHPDLSDWLLLIAVVLFVLDAIASVLVLRRDDDGTAHRFTVRLVSLGLAAFALGMFVL